MSDLSSLIKVAGVLGVALAVFAESGLLVGIVLPGDSLLFTAGFLASQGFFSIVPLVIATFAAAVAGDSIGYWLGARLGPRVFSRQDSRFFNPAHIARAQEFYAHYGAKTVILARFVPIVRTLAPVLAGVGSMRYRTFALYNILGGALWALGIPLAGYWIGTAIPSVDAYLIPIIAAIIVLSIAPTAWHALRAHRKNS